MHLRTTRRSFLRGLSAAAAAPLAGSRILRPYGACSRLGLAAVGVGGQGGHDLARAARGQDVVALCDVDGDRLARARMRYGAQTYRDWRRMLEQKDVDAVVVSVPDHMHAAIAAAAMQLGRHVYVQKPLTHSVFEARQLRLLAERTKVVTQMGNQHRSAVHQKTARVLVQQGAIGRVVAAHCWTNRPIWPQGIDRPAGHDQVPASFDWDLWLGVAPERPYVREAYHPFRWRGFWDFGTGALGDMGCHLMDPVLWILDLPPPARVSAEGPEPSAESAPKWCIVRYEFPASGGGRPFELTWYDGGKLPPAEACPLPEGKKLPDNGTLFVGTEGSLLCDEGSGVWLLPAEPLEDRKLPEVVADDHHQQWVAACKGDGRCVSDFASAGPVTEAVLLGNVAFRAGGAIEWDAEKLEAKGPRAAQTLLRDEVRKGWETLWPC
jgi:predicted dehydrogenase